MSPTLQILVAIGASVITATILTIFLRRGGATHGADELVGKLTTLEAEIAALRDAKGSVERRLAVEEEKVSRIPGLERSLRDKTEQIDGLVQGKAAVESQLAAAKEALARVEATAEDLKIRLLATEQGREEVRAQLEEMRREKGALEESLAAKNEALSRVESDQTALQTRYGVTIEDLQTERKALSDLRERLAQLQETLDQERRQSVEKLALLAGAKEQMTQEFRLLADEVMKLHAENFSKQNKEQIDAVLLPLRERLGEFQQGLQIAHTESAKERATLGEQIRTLTESSARMTLEANNLARALKGQTQTRGAWGEMILGTILERCGLREGEEYVVQENLATESGGRRRPDVIVNLPGGQRIIVDSKVSLNAFEEFVNAEDETVRSSSLIRHLNAMRGHIKDLSSKEYHLIGGSHVDYVIMFVPIEGALAAALQQDAGLTGYAVENGVAIATPTTLMIALRTVANVWQVERRNRNAEAIADRAGKLYDKMVGFVEDMSTLGNRLNQARTEYDKAMGKLSTGGGNLIRQVEQLKELGAKTGKSLPAELLDGVNAPALPQEMEISGA